MPQADVIVQRISTCSTIIPEGSGFSETSADIIEQISFKSIKQFADRFTENRWHNKTHLLENTLFNMFVH